MIQSCAEIRPSRNVLAAKLIGIWFASIASSFCVAVPIDFEAEVRPILSRHCYDCHGDGHRKGGLSLESERDALQGGDSLHAAYMAGDSLASALVQRVLSEDPALRMPPKGDALSVAEVETLKAWIDGGAGWGAKVVVTTAQGNDHWAFKAPVQATPPTVRDASWVRNPVDAFVLARLDKEGIKPSPEADRYTLARRLYLDLTGLPPSLEALDAFVSDAAPGAYERLVETLLASPHYGERMAVPWLDAARYADTNGFEKDRPRSIWPYRDWVINAFNRNLPFDRFVVEQLAGDMLPGATLEQRIATGFLRNTMLNEEGGVDQEEYRYEAIVDRVNTAGTVILGLTLACAQCHTHKYDPITQREYFQFMAFLNNADEVEAVVPQAEITAKREKLAQEIATLEGGLLAKFPIDPTLHTLTPLKPSQAHAASGGALRVLDDGAVLAEGAAAEEDIYTVMLDAPPGNYTGIRLEVLRDETLPSQGPGRADNGNFVLTEITARRFSGDGGASPVDLSFAKAEAEVEQAGFAVAGAIDDSKTTGWAVDVAPEGPNVDRTASFRFEVPLVIAEGAPISVSLEQQYGKQHLLGKFRVSLYSEDLPEGREAAQRAHFEQTFSKWREEVRAKAVAWTPLDVVEATSKNHVTFQRMEDKSLLVKGDNPNTDTYTVSYRTALTGITALRLEVLPDPSLPGGGPGRGIIMSPNEGDFLLSEISVTSAPWAAPAQVAAVALQNATQDFAASGREAAKAMDGKLDTGWSVMGGEGKPHAAVFEFGQAVGHDGGTLLTFTMDQHYVHLHTIGRFRVSVTTAPLPVQASGVPGEIEAALLASPDGPGNAEVQAYFLATTPELSGEHTKIAALRAQMPKQPTSLVLEEREVPRVTKIHHRGEFLQPKDAVQADVPAVLPPLPAEAPRNRLTLARWLVSEENPLTARVAVNQAWQMVFGRGLVNTTEDFGVRGDAPSHPELLDWLAVEFVRRGWDMKDLVRTIVTSATYRQDSRVSPEMQELDPTNELLARGARFRVDGEFVRDIALSASRQIALKVGGPSVFPPLPEGMLSLVYASGGWTPSEGDDKYRRGLYTFWKRTMPYPTSITFDCPARDVTVVKRVRSNTPLQALTQLNDPVFVEAAEAMATRVLAGGGTVEARVRAAFLLCTNRPPDAVELGKMGAFVKAQQARFASGELDAGARSPEQAAWAALCRALLNLDETISRG